MKINGLHLWEIRYEPNQHIGDLLITTKQRALVHAEVKAVKFLRNKFSRKAGWRIKNVKWVGTLDA